MTISRDFLTDLESTIYGWKTVGRRTPEYESAWDDGYRAALRECARRLSEVLQENRDDIASGNVWPQEPPPCNDAECNVCRGDTHVIGPNPDTLPIGRRRL